MTVLDVSRPALTCWRVPTSSIELVTQRTEHTKLFYNLNGTLTRVISRDLHYFRGSSWHNQDLILHPVSHNERHVNDNHVQLNVENRRGQSVIEVSSKDRGIRFHIPKPAIFADDNTFAFMGALSTWKYEMLSHGPKLSILIQSPRRFFRDMEMVYHIRYSKVGNWNFSVDDGGNLRADELTIPRPFILGADGNQYPCSPWEFNSEHIWFVVDDSRIPLSAYPYIIDPTTTLQPNPGIDTRILSNAATTNYQSTTGVSVGDALASNQLQKMLIEFDLSSVPSDQDVTNATLSLYEYAAADEAGVGTWAINVHRILVNWVVSQATYNWYSTDNDWTTAGCLSDGNDRVAAVSATDAGRSGTADGAFLDLDGNTLDSDVKQIVDGGISNYGWLVESPNAESKGSNNVHTTYYTGNWTTASRRPKLAVTHELNSDLLGSYLQNEGLEPNQFILQPPIMLPG